jgi:hypothetical protein
MEMQAEAERRKRAEILESEGRREAAINNAEGQRKSAILAAQGDADALLNRAKAAAQAIEMLGSSIRKTGGREAVTMRLAEQYVAAFARIAKNGNTILLPAQVGDPSAMVAQAVTMWQSLNNRTAGPLSSDPTSIESDVTADGFLGSSATADGIGAAMNAVESAAKKAQAHAEEFVPKPLESNDPATPSIPGFTPKPF